MSDVGLSTRSSNEMLQLATNSSGGMAASWNTVRPMLWPLWISVVKSSFHDGFAVLARVVVRANVTSSMSMDTYGSTTVGVDRAIRPTWCRVAKSVGRRSSASTIVSFIVPLKKTIVTNQSATNYNYHSVMYSCQWHCQVPWLTSLLAPSSTQQQQQTKSKSTKSPYYLLLRDSHYENKKKNTNPITNRTRWRPSEEQVYIWFCSMP